VGDGFRVHGFIPGKHPLSMKRMSPFLLLDYNAKVNFSPSETPRGVGVHPHRGFETVTIAYKGEVAHHDSSGGGGVISEGDVQWMTAASGILHKEFHEEGYSKKGGDFQMVQLWVNLPAKDKMSEPKYQAIKNEEMTKLELENNAGTLEIIAGSYGNAKGTASTFTPINLFNVYLKKGADISFSFAEIDNTALLVIEGSITVNNTDKAPTDHFVLFTNNGEDFTVRADEDALVLILSGQPINEPIASHGPFVMNTDEEIMQAIKDFQSGKFGYLD
jgi:redox-sensitive bicupin YhaK (pirin superfamily)